MSGGCARALGLAIGRPGFRFCRRSTSWGGEDVGYGAADAHKGQALCSVLSHVIFHLISTPGSQVLLFPHFTDGEIEPQRGE